LLSKCSLYRRYAKVPGNIVFEKIAHLINQAGTGLGTDTAAAVAKAAVAATAAGDQAAQGSAAAGGNVPKGLTLHKYQREGVQWLLSKLKHKQSAILGDQMGLGKTIQTAVFVDAARTLGLMKGPVLIVAPLSTVPNWTAELRLWCPTLNCVTYIGNAEVGMRLMIFYAAAPPDDSRKVCKM
jgi:SNF2 family DNA or RNA helicase